MARLLRDDPFYAAAPAARALREEGGDRVVLAWAALACAQKRWWYVLTQPCAREN